MPFSAKPPTIGYCPTTEDDTTMPRTTTRLIDGTDGLQTAVRSTICSPVVEARGIAPEHVHGEFRDAVDGRQISTDDIIEVRLMYQRNHPTSRRRTARTTTEASR